MSEMRLQEAEGGEAAARGWPVPPIWLGLLTLAWILYELTAQPGLGVIAICLKLGWDDFRTALWLRRRDPSRRRGRVCYWLYLANSAWKVGVVALLLIITVSLVLKHRQPGPAPLRDRLLEVLIGSLLMVSGGFVVALLATCRTVWLSWRYDIRLWLHSAVQHAWNRDDWPPQRYCGGRSNRLGWLLFPQMAFSIFIVVVCLNAKAEAVGLIAFLIAFLGGPLLGLIYRDIFLKHLFAESPEQCWGAQIGDEKHEGEA